MQSFCGTEFWEVTILEPEPEPEPEPQLIQPKKVLNEISFLLSGHAFVTLTLPGSRCRFWYCNRPRRFKEKEGSTTKHRFRSFKSCNFDVLCACSAKTKWEQ